MDLLPLMMAAPDAAEAIPEGLISLDLFYYVVGGLCIAIMSMAGSMVLGARYYAAYVNKVSGEKDAIQEQYNKQLLTILKDSKEDEKNEALQRQAQTRVIEDLKLSTDSLKASVDTMGVDVKDLYNVVDDSGRGRRR